MHIELKTDGGIHGRGLGGIVIDDDEVTAIEPTGARHRGRLTFEERDAIQRAIGRLEIHPPATSAEALRDAVRYSLKMDAFGRPLSTHTWNENEAAPTVLHLRDVLWKIGERVKGS